MKKKIKFWFCVGVFFTVLWIVLKKMFTEKTFHGTVKEAENIIKKNNKKLKNIRKKKINEKHYHDMSNKSLVSEFRRFRDKRKNKQK